MIIKDKISKVINNINSKIFSSKIYLDIIKRFFTLTINNKDIKSIYII